MLTLYALALTVTLIVEVPIVSAFYPSARARMALACIAAATVTTITLDVAVARATRAHVAWSAALVAGQAVALVVEAAVYARVARRSERGWSRALAAAAAANLASYGAGLLFF